MIGHLCDNDKSPLCDLTIVEYIQTHTKSTTYIMNSARKPLQ